MQKFKNVANFIKDYVGVFLVLPTVLGGLWQLGNLASISFGLVRYFSLTQIIQDGLLVLLIFIVIGLAGGLVIFFIWTSNELFKEFENSFRFMRLLRLYIYRVRMKVHHLIMVILATLPFFYFIYFYTAPSGDGKYFKSTYEIFALVISISLCLLLFYVQQRAKGVLKVVLIFPIFAYLIYAGIFTSGRDRGSLEDQLIKPKYVANMHNLKYNLIQENPKAIDVDVLYTNDKYIFVKIIYKEISKSERDTINTIQILEFNRLFEPRIEIKTQDSLRPKILY